MFTLTETFFATISYFLWSVNYKNLVYKLFHTLWKSRDAHIVYTEMYVVVTYIETLFPTTCYFFSSICWSVNCMSQVSKFHNFFLTCLETEAIFVFESFNYCQLWKVQFQLFSTFLAFFIWSVNYSRDIFSLFAGQ